MKNNLTLFFLLSFSNNFFGQELFEYEKKIKDIENYHSTDLEFFNSTDDIKLYGTLVEPKTKYEKLVIIVPGSGMDTRNNHYLLAENLLKNNIAVLRYDERGVGKSDGIFSAANYTITQMARDLDAIYQAVKSSTALASKKTGFISHSQGAMVTMILLEQGIKPDFMVQWAAPVEKHGAFLKYQLQNGTNKFENELIFDNIEKKLEIMDIFHKAFGGTPTENDWKEDYEISKKALKKAKQHGYTKKNYHRFYYSNFNSWKHIIKKDLEQIYASSEVPMLYIIGSEDKYVDPVSETRLLQSLSVRNMTITIMPDLNHYLTKGALTIESMYEIDDDANNEITNWIKNN